MLHSNDIRQKFLDFFISKAHKVVPSAPMVIKNDPSLMFTNAGMNQFKDIFLGHEKPFAPRVADAQKCLRVSGKQNDLEEVGHDTYHHTMFEMLGNWSFGDYFKAEAIAWAWELLVEVFKVDRDRLYVTVFEGSEREGLEPDKEAYDLWAKIVPKERILFGSAKDNFWEMGDTGPCGPCSEIHVDIRPDEERKRIPGADLVNQDHPLVIEIWNLVFIQFNRKADGSLESLPEKHVDTGMGFERLCMVLQGKTSNYDTDVFQPLMLRFAELANARYGEDEKKDVALRVVADHLRAVAFSIADGQLPSNNKAGYVIRRILRRAVRYGYSFLGFREPFLCRALPTMIAQMGENYPELKAQKRLIESVIREEEAAFLRTLNQGIELLHTRIEAAKAENQTELNGEVAFTLYDTYGFPLDLTELMLREVGMRVDQKGFEECMAQQKARSRNASQVSTGDWIVVKEGPMTKFVGYDTLEADVRIQKMREVESKGKKSYQIVLDESPFYAESGGQVGDQGFLRSANESIQVRDTIKENTLPILIVNKLPENPEVVFHAKVNGEARESTAIHHTATHLMHYALRKVLGNHVEQKGSLVCATHLRFDFSHYQKMTADEIREVERIVNSLVRQASPRIEYREMPIDDAKKMGALALFGEKYGERVRVLVFGESVEFCGGTHVENTGQIGLFRIVSESAIAAGIRRIEAIAGGMSEERDYYYSDTINFINGQLHSRENTAQAVQMLKEENLALKKELERLQHAQLEQLANELLSRATKIEDINFVSATVEDQPVDGVKEIAQMLRERLAEPSIVIIGSHSNQRPALAITITPALAKAKSLHAGKIIKEAAKHIAGGGGGQASFATAGGKNIGGLAAAMQQAEEMLRKGL